MAIGGKTLVFTGTLTMKRADASSMATQAGAAVASNVSGKTDILVAGKDAGSKVAAAEKKGMAIWTEAQFVAACTGDNDVGKQASKECKENSDAAEPPLKPAPVKVAPAKKAPPTMTVPPPKKTIQKKPVAKKAAASESTAGDSMPLAEMRFLRTGSFQYQKAVGDFVTSLGGTWVKSSSQATHSLDGRAEGMHAQNWSKKGHYEMFAKAKPVVALEHNFTGGAAHTPAMVQEFL